MIETADTHSGVLMFPAGDTMLPGVEALMAELTQRLTQGSRLISLFGGPGGISDEIALHAVLLELRQGLTHLQARRNRNTPYYGLTRHFPEFHCFEREIYEQYKLLPIAHPWLKPIRFERDNLRKMDDYPFYKLNGKEVHEVGVGPIHAGVIEPGHFRFMCLGEIVHHLEIHNGYQHRGAEALLLQQSPKKLAPLVESIAGDTAVGYVLAFCRAWESLCNVTMGPEVELVRGIALELERIAMHLVGLSGVATDVAFLPGSTTYGRLRTSVINMSMRMCGSRFGRSWFRPGEMRFAVTKELIADLISTMEFVQRDIATINQHFQKSKTVQHRLQGIGTVTKETAREIGLVGMAGRVSGLERDLRFELSEEIYRSRDLPLVVESSGDCWARALVRIREIDASLNWILRVAKELPELPAVKLPLEPPRPNSAVVSVVEGWRGELMHYLETDSNGKLAHYKVQDPSIRNWFGLAHALRNNAIYDFPICNKSFDLSYCGTDL